MNFLSQGYRWCSPTLWTAFHTLHARSYFTGAIMNHGSRTVIPRDDCSSFHKKRMQSLSGTSLSFYSYLCRTYLIHLFVFSNSTNLDHFLGGWPNSLALSVAIWIPRAIADRTRPSSIANRPAIVQPAGAIILVRLRNENSNPSRTCYRIFELRRMRTTMQDHSSCTLYRCQIFNR